MSNGATAFGDYNDNGAGAQCRGKAGSVGLTVVGVGTLSSATSLPQIMGHVIQMACARMWEMPDITR